MDSFIAKEEMMFLNKEIVYWSIACLEPTIEGVSKEVFQLAGHFRDSLIFGINTQYLFRMSLGQRYIGFHSRLDPLLRILIPLVELSCRINHIYGEICPWIFYKTLKRKPLVLTIASEKGRPQLDFMARCHKIIVQTETLRREILALGIDRTKVELLYPAIDLARFRPLPKVSGLSKSPRVLFATAPRSQEEMVGRGVYLVLEAAKASPDIHYRLLYRTWKSGYTSLQPTKDWIACHKPQNVMLTNSAVQDMPSIYNGHHFTVIPYMQPDGGKECPNSLVESLSCGTPVIISSVSRFAYFIDEHKCGVVFKPTPSDLVAAIDTGLTHYHELSKNAVVTANRYFSKERYLNRMEQIYQKLLS
jgi:glycosyltransferase involved in cell wall biosynthesis